MYDYVGPSCAMNLPSAQVSMWIANDDSFDKETQMFVYCYAGG